MNSTKTEPTRAKRGEIYQLPNNQFSFVCVHCSNEFQYFTDFALHVQQHFDLDFQKATEFQDCSVKIERMQTNSSNASTEEPFIHLSNIKVIDESDDDYEFTNDFESEYKDESSASSTRQATCERKKTLVKQSRFECFICHKQLSTSFAVKRHMKIHSVKDLQCKICYANFRTSRYYERHMSALHPNNMKFVSQLPITEEPIRKTKIYECNFCKKKFRDRRQLQNHKTSHKQRPCLCLICGQLFSGDRTLNRHMKLHEESDETHPCTECNRTFKQRRYLLEHNRKVHKLYADNSQVTCETCGEEFENKRSLQIHSQSHPYVEKRNFPCSTCGFAAACAYDLRRHIETHNIENRSFECHICHKKFLPRYANDHMKWHDPSRGFKCKECGKTFKRATALKRHQSTHGNGPTFNCDVCSKQFVRYDGLLRHRRRHGVAMNYHCRVCNKGFIEQKSYLVHEATHNKGNVNNTEEILLSVK